jgi:hypothetical protein
MPFIPKSMEFLPEEISPAVKARTHLLKAEDVKEPHFQYLELWKGFEALYLEQKKPTTKLLANRAGGRDAGPLDLMGACLTSMSRPRVELLLAHAEIPNLMMLLGRKNLKKLIGENELLADNGLDDAAWQVAKKDLTFNLKANYWKAAEGLARVLFLVRGAADPKVRKTDNLVSDVVVLKGAYDVLRFALKNLTAEEGEEQETFMGVGNRTKVATDARAKLMKGGKKA